MSDDEKPSWEWKQQVAALEQQIAELTGERNMLRRAQRNLADKYNGLSQQLAQVTREAQIQAMKDERETQP